MLVLSHSKQRLTRIQHCIKAVHTYHAYVLHSTMAGPEPGKIADKADQL